MSQGWTRTATSTATGPRPDELESVIPGLVTPSSMLGALGANRNGSSVHSSAISPRGACSRPPNLLRAFSASIVKLARPALVSSKDVNFACAEGRSGQRDEGYVVLLSCRWVRCGRALRREPARAHWRELSFLRPEARDLSLLRRRRDRGAPLRARDSAVGARALLQLST